MSVASDMVYPQSLSNNPKERMIQLIQLMTKTETNPKKLSLNSNSNSAAIGKLCLPFLLNTIATIVNNISSSSSGEMNDILQTIMQSLSNCASTCPSLLGGDAQLLSMVCHTLITVGEKNPDPMVQLSALEALVTLCMVPDMKKILTENPSLRNLCLVGNHESGNGNGGIVGVCAQLIVKGVDDDLNEWAMEEVALQVRFLH